MNDSDFSTIISIIAIVFAILAIMQTKRQNDIFNQEIQKDDDEEDEVPSIRHVPPKYWAYKGGFDSVVQCDECQTLALYEDMHPVNPCKFCGGRVREKYSGKWIPSKRKWEVRPKGK